MNTGKNTEHSHTDKSGMMKHMCRGDCTVCCYGQIRSCN